VVHVPGMPSITFCTFASGSTGNCAYLATDTTRVLVDAGISTRRIEGHLAALGTSLAAVSGVCVTHEHSDHIQALPVMQRKYGVPLYANAGTVESLARNPKFADLHWHVFTNGHGFEIGDLRFEPYSIPHDAFDPVGYVVRWGEVKIGFATDIGLPTHLIKQQLKGCHVLVLEANHDHVLLNDAQRPWSLKQRIAGRQGHLSNEQAAELLLAVAGPELRRVYAAHLSLECNCPDVARGTLRRALDGAGFGHVELVVASPTEASVCWTLEAGS
jgi:phosphoribosyl 1,2-cyclic phosphodiesterase